MIWPSSHPRGHASGILMIITTCWSRSSSEFPGGRVRRTGVAVVNEDSSRRRPHSGLMELAAAAQRSQVGHLFDRRQQWPIDLRGDSDIIVGNLDRLVCGPIERRTSGLVWEPFRPTFSARSMEADLPVMIAIIGLRARPNWPLIRLAVLSRLGGGGAAIWHCARWIRWNSSENRER